MQKITTTATIIRDPAEINTIRDTGAPEGEERRDINVSKSEIRSVHTHICDEGCCTCTCVSAECVDVQMCGLVADWIVQHTAVGVFILIFHLQR